MPTMLHSHPIRVRRATRADAPALIRLIVALAQFERLTPPDQNAEQRLIEHGFGPRPRFEAWLAFVNDLADPVGYAVVFETYSTFEAASTLYLEDVFVLPDYRGRGIGTQLLHECVQIAQDRGCARMEWVCLDWNTRAQQKYEKMGARQLKEWLIYRLDRAGIDKYAAERSSFAKDRK